jgi:hypothetical protein
MGLAVAFVVAAAAAADGAPFLCRHRGSPGIGAALWAAGSWLAHRHSRGVVS